VLRTLLESQAKSSRRAGGTAISIALHTAIIGGAIVATARATTAPREKPEVRPDVIYAAPPVPRKMPPATSTSRTSTSAPVVPVVRPVFMAPISVPDHLPAIDYTRPPADGMIFGRGAPLVGPPPGNGGLGSSPDGVYTERLVEKVAAPQPGNPAPVYPAPLRSAQIEGTVVARFVVDTSGRAEPNSITFAESTHAQFSEAVRQALLRSRYLPATIAGHPVRQLVEQRFAFTLTR
jgi:protein TonB